MSDIRADTVIPWRSNVVQDFASSELFERTFEEGMDLVEETAAYLDGAGRQESKMLSRAAALAYAGESMRLTTRLMQVASWLLVQRAVREGAMPAEEACDDRYRLNSEPEAENVDASLELPAALLTLIGRSGRLFDRILHLDRRMYVEDAKEAAVHPVLSQHEMLLAAFAS